MAVLDEAQLIRDLERDEGRKLTVYKCTAGKNTVGIGRNLDDVGLSHAEQQALGCTTADLRAGKVALTSQQADLLCANDVARVKAELDRNVPWWRDLPEPGQRGLANMLFNLGWSRLSGFKKMLAALKAGKFHHAADEARDSDWFNQVGRRAERICEMFMSCAAAK